MIQEIMLFGMGFTLATFIKQMKIASITKEKSRELDVATAKAEEMQEKFNTMGSSQELVKEQMKSFKELERHIAYREILHKFNYLIW